MRGKIKPTGDIIGHGVQWARVIKYEWRQTVVEFLRRKYSEEFINYGVDGGILLEGPRNGGSIITTRCGSPPDWCLDNCG